MRTRTTILLALALAVASVLAWLDTPATPVFFGEGGAPAQPASEGIVRLLSFSADTVERVRLQRGPVDTILVRSDDGWSGIDDPKTVDDFLQALQELAQILVLEAAEGHPADYGLDPPAAQITLERAGDTPIVLRFGNQNPTATGVYAQVGAHGPVVLTGALALWDFDKIMRRLQPTGSAASNIATIGRYES
jgi:hypothetical protein